MPAAVASLEPVGEWPEQMWRRVAEQVIVVGNTILRDVRGRAELWLLPESAGRAWGGSAYPVAPDEIHTELPFYGIRRIRNELRDRGFTVGRASQRRAALDMGIAHFALSCRTGTRWSRAAPCASKRECCQTEGRPAGRATP